MPEPRHEAIEAHVADRFPAVMVADGGATYWHTAKVVVRRAGFHPELLENLALADNEALIVIVPDEEDSEFSGSFADMEGFIHLGIAAATPYKVQAETSLKPTGPLLRVTVQNRLLQDVRRVIQTDKHLQNEAGTNLALWANVARASKVPRETFKAGWAIAYAEVEIHHMYEEGDPS